MKKLLAVILALACLFSLCACAAKEEGEGTPEGYVALCSDLEDKKKLSDADAEAVMTLIDDPQWEDVAYICQNLAFLTVGDREVYYCHECGRINDEVNNGSFRLYAIEAEALEGIIYSYFEE